MSARLVTFVGVAFLLGYAYSSNGQYGLPYLQTFIPVAGIAYALGIFAYCDKISSNLGWLALLGISGLIFSNFVNPLNIFSTPFPFANIYSAPYPFAIVFYCFTLVGFSAIVAHPPNILSKFTILGEESYALYAIHVAFIMVFGMLGVLYALISAFLIEFSLRRQDIIRRLKIAYSPQVSNDLH